MDSSLPESVAEIAEIIGRPQALYLIGRLPACGARSWRVVLYVPKTLPSDHWLVRVLGWGDALALVRHFGGEILQPSNCRCLQRAHRDRAIVRMSKEGAATREIAATMGLTPRRVRGVLAASAACGAQKKAGPSRPGALRG